MARARQLKPGFFKNEDLARCTPWARLMYAGLWTLGDREGRLEDRPLRIKGELFPFDDVDPQVLLNELAAATDNLGQPAFIVRYEVDGGKYIQIIHFAKHQNPHVKEGPSTIPAPCKPGASTRRAPGRHRASRASSLTPSSLTVDSLQILGGATEPEFPPEDPPPPVRRFVPPTIEEATAHCQQKGYHFSPEEFIAYYASQGWKKANGRPVVDWHGCCVTFEQTWKGKHPPPAAPTKPATLCRDCREPMTKIETMEGTTCRACRKDHGV